MRQELKRLQRELGITMVFVTHDQEEALILADRMAVMEEGRLLQLRRAGGDLPQPGQPLRGRFSGAEGLGVAAGRNGLLKIIRRDDKEEHAMLVDMHLHESTYSIDSFHQPGADRHHRQAQGAGRGVHHRPRQHGPAGDARRPTPARTGFPIFVGVEYFSLQGDITAWGIDSYPRPPHSTPRIFIDQVNADRDGFCVSCHPFRNNNRGLEREPARCPRSPRRGGPQRQHAAWRANRTALRFCRELGLKAIGASDAHVPEQVGKYVTWLPETVTTLPDFVTALHTLETRPAIWTGSGYDVVTEF